jgi:hypothetical protein
VSYVPDDGVVAYLIHDKSRVHILDCRVRVVAGQSKIRDSEELQRGRRDSQVKLKKKREALVKLNRNRPGFWRKLFWNQQKEVVGAGRFERPTPCAQGTVARSKGSIVYR